MFNSNPLYPFLTSLTIFSFFYVYFFLSKTGTYVIKLFTKFIDIVKRRTLKISPRKKIPLLVLWLFDFTLQPKVFDSCGKTYSLIFSIIRILSSLPLSLPSTQRPQRQYLILTIDNSSPSKRIQPAARGGLLFVPFLTLTCLDKEASKGQKQIGRLFVWKLRAKEVKKRLNPASKIFPLLDMNAKIRGRPDKLISA